MNLVNWYTKKELKKFREAVCSSNNKKLKKFHREPCSGDALCPACSLIKLREEQDMNKEIRKIRRLYKEELKDKDDIFVKILINVLKKNEKRK